MMDRFQRGIFHKQKQPWVEEDDEEIPCPTPVRSIPPPELWEEYNQRRQEFTNQRQPPTTGHSKKDLDLNLRCGSPEKCSQDLVNDVDEQDRGGASGSGTKRAFEDNQQSNGSNSGSMPTNPKQPFQLFPEQGEPLGGGATNFGDGMSDFGPFDLGQPHPMIGAAYAGGGLGGSPVYVDHERPVMGAENTGGGIGDGFQPFPEQYSQGTGVATVGGGVGRFPMYLEQNRLTMGAIYEQGGVGGIQMFANQYRPAAANSCDVGGGFPVYPDQQYWQGMGATNANAGIPIYAEQYQTVMGAANEGGRGGGGLQLFPEHNHPETGASNAESQVSEFQGFSDLNRTAIGAANADSEEYERWPFHGQVDSSHVNSSQKQCWDLNF